VSRAARLAGAIALAACPAWALAQAQAPQVPASGFRETLHGREVADPYRWMEDTASPAAQAFYRMQSAHAREELGRLPGRAALLERIRSLSEFSVRVTSLQLAGGRIFYLKEAPGWPGPVLAMRESFNAAEKVLVEPGRLAKSSEIVTLEGYAPSPDGRYVAYGIAAGGRADAVLRVREVATLRDVPVEIDRAHLDDGLAWHPDSRSFYYARRAPSDDPRRLEAAIRIYRHQVGREATRDEIVFAPGVGGARDVPDFAFPRLHLPIESTHAYAIVREGSRREIAVHMTSQRDLAAGRPRWRRIVAPADEVLAIEAWREDILLLSHRGTQRNRVLGMKASHPEISRAREVVPEGDLVIESFGLAKDALYLRLSLGGIARLERMPIEPLGRPKPEFLKTPFDNQIAELVTDPRRPGALLRFDGWIEPPSIREVDARTGELRDTRLQPPPASSFAEMDEVRLHAVAPDGVRIPVTLVYRKSTALTGDNPTLLLVHGSHGARIPPAFDPTRLAWLERGGVLAIAHVRGGGEFGEPWHRAGSRANKPNTVHDLVAVADFIVKYGFTNPKRLAILATGHGAIAVGGLMAKRPELAAAVAMRAPWADLLRAEASSAGAAHVGELGTVADAADFTRLQALSPVHQVRDGVAYPAAIFFTGVEDPRVPPWQAGKLTARLQGAMAGGKPVLLRADFPTAEEGSLGRRRREEELADLYAFLLWQFGEPGFQPPVSIPPIPLPSSAPPAPEAKAP